MEVILNTNIVKLKADTFIRREIACLAGVVLVAGLFPQASVAKTTDVELKQFLIDLCVYGQPPATALQMCSDFNRYLMTTSNFTAAANAGSAGSEGNSVSRSVKEIRDRSDEEKRNSDKGASSDEGRWGVLLAPQYGKSRRVDTALENGYMSTLNGLVFGVDYRFSDALVAGVAIGHVKDDAQFVNDVGYSRSSSNSATVYGTWLASNRLTIDGYLGYGKSLLENQHRLVFGFTSGTVKGETSARQILAGLSAGVQADIGTVSFSPFAGFDFIKSDFDSYSETGVTSLEFRYADRQALSSTGRLGMRAEKAGYFGWGALNVSARVTGVHEFHNESKTIRNELVVAPGVGFSIQTDESDADYVNLGVGVSATLNGGGQLFIDYEKRARDRLLEDWAVSLGGLFEF
jgi:uncharacterized protein YhjY with autotransporter beta-barrel domain